MISSYGGNGDENKKKSTKKDHSDKKGLRHSVFTYYASGVK